MQYFGDWKVIVKMEKRTRRIAMSVFGVLVAGISVGFFRMAVFGVDPFQSFMSGLDIMIPIDFGTLYVIANICLLLFSLIFDRHKIGIATFINLFLLGYVVEFSHQQLLKWFPDLGIPGRIIMLVIGIVVMCLASAFYFTADMGVSTYDAVSLIISEKCKILPFKVWRILADLVCVILGVGMFLAAGNKLSEVSQVAGVGTIITAFFMGPLISFFNTHVAQPFLNK